MVKVHHWCNMPIILRHNASEQLVYAEFPNLVNNETTPSPVTGAESFPNQP